ncbi:MAG: SRPBCC family protein [Rhodospirillaceae bacterium]|nr:SRPBCC family protein [Rhodospirillaceae bacterium]
MTSPLPFTLNPKTDLVLERTIDVPANRVWMAWTTPQHLKPWFCPKPWVITKCEIDLRPGGAFRFDMQGPEGQTQSFTACYLEVVPEHRLVWTLALEPGFRPAAKEPLPGVKSFTAIISLTPRGSTTVYNATVLHPDETSAKTHDEMGFTDGWGTALTQMVEYVKTGM